jgi:hypothetical protein
MRGAIVRIAAVAALCAAGCGSSGSRSARQGGPGGVGFGTAGPWPVANAVYGAADGISESPVVGVTTDEAQNRWVATPAALYLLRPGETRFRRYDASAGLHLPENAVSYCDDHPMKAGDRCNGTVTTGSGLAITRIVGGAPGEVFVGYAGVDLTPGTKCAPKDPSLPPNEGFGDYCDPAHHSGKIDRVHLGADGSLAVDRMDLVTNKEGGEYWHDRTIQRLVFDHLVHPHTLYAGTNHGVTILFPDRYRAPRPGEWYDAAYSEWMGDHLHATVCDPGPCGTDEGAVRMGDWAGLAVDASGNLWHAGRWTAGLITWDADPIRWVTRYGAAFAKAFGDPYPIAPNADGFTNEPVFKVAREGDSPHLTGAAVCPDGRVWFTSSGPQSGTSDVVAVWDGRKFTTFAAGALGLPAGGARDVACLPDGRVALASSGAGVILYDPVSGATKPVPGLPGGDVQVLEVDRTIDPPALHVATGAGAAVLRVLP